MASKKDQCCRILEMYSDIWLISKLCRKFAWFVIIPLGPLRYFSETKANICCGRKKTAVWPGYKEAPCFVSPKDQLGMPSCCNSYLLISLLVSSSVAPCGEFVLIRAVLRGNLSRWVCVEVSCVEGKSIWWDGFVLRKAVLKRKF